MFIFVIIQPATVYTPIYFKSFAGYLIILCLISSGIYSQTNPGPIRIKNYRIPTAGTYNTWDVSGHMGFTYPRTDISASGKRDFAIGADVTKFITHSFAMEFRLLHASLSGIDENRPQYRYNSTINYDMTINAVVQFGNISFLKRNPNLSVFGKIGFGILHYSPEVYLDGGINKLPGIYSQYSQPLETTDYRSSTDYVIPLGFGVKYRVSDNLSIMGEYSFRKTNSDKLDGFFKLLSADDDYMYFAAGVTYHLGKNDKVLEWVNPLQVVYTDLYEMKERIDQLTKDSDNDGVADLYDREPGTKTGSKVYGDGTSVDTDEDGVPDLNDAELFTKKNARVDATGREIKSVSEDEQIKTTGKISVDYIPSVYFTSGSEIINLAQYEALGKIAKVLNDNPNEKFKIIGNCDASGSREYNLRLGKRRAAAVRNFLIRRYGISSERMKTEVTLDENIRQGADPAGRRVDIKIMK